MELASFTMVKVAGRVLFVVISLMDFVGEYSLFNLLYLGHYKYNNGETIGEIKDNKWDGKQTIYV